jgi:hypothetical protein
MFKAEDGVTTADPNAAYAGFRLEAVPGSGGAFPGAA